MIHFFSTTISNDPEFFSQYGTSSESIALLLSAIALAISLYSASLTRKSIIAAHISTNRIQWIGTVRKLIYHFLKEYRTKRRKKVLIDMYTKIMLYFNPLSSSYIYLVEFMKKAINADSFDNVTYWSIVVYGQQVLNDHWVRMKLESGISPIREQIVTAYLKTKYQGPDPLDWNPDINAFPTIEAFTQENDK